MKNQLKFYYVFLGVLFLATAWFSQSAIDSEHLWVKITAVILGLMLVSNGVFLIMRYVKNKAWRHKIFRFLFLLIGCILTTALWIAFDSKIFQYISLLFAIAFLVLGYRTVLELNNHNK